MDEIIYSTTKRNYTALDIEALEIIAEAYRISQEKKLYTEEETIKFSEWCSNKFKRFYPKDRKVISQGLAELKSHMLLPLNFLTAANMNPEFSRDIEDAMLKSYTNLPKLPGRTLFIVDVSGSMNQVISDKSENSRLYVASAMALLAVHQCEDYELVTTAGADRNWTCTSEHLKYPKKGFDLQQQIQETRRRVGQGGIFTRQCLEWCRKNISGDFERIIVFSDSQDMDRQNKIPNPYGKYNYICDVSANTRGVNYKGLWTAEISGWSEHFLTYIAAFEGLQNNFEIE